MTFVHNNVNGLRLLSLTESELKEQNGFGIESLGRRKKIIRAINFLKATSCHGANHCGSLLLPIPRPATTLRQDFRMNRSQIFHRRIDHNALNKGMIDKE